MLDTHTFFAIIFTQDVAELLHIALAEGIIEAFKFLILAPIVVLVLTYIVHRHKFRSHRDNEHLSASLSYFIDENDFKIRAPNREERIEDLYVNLILRRAFLKSANRTTPEDPIMEFPPALEPAIMSALQGYVTGQYGESFFKVAAGLRMYAVDFVLMPTNEHYGLIRVRKPRIVIIQRDLLFNLPDDIDPVAFEKNHHAMRLNTIRKIAKRYHAMSPEQQENHKAEILFDRKPKVPHRRYN